MNNEMSDNETTQQRQYKLLHVLQVELQKQSLEIQQRLPYDLLMNLSSCLLDSTIFTIITDMEEIQNLTEKSMFAKKQQLAADHKDLKQEMRGKHKEELMVCKEHNITLLKARQVKELEELDKRIQMEVDSFNNNILLELDQKVSDQQNTLQQAGVPGFFVTKDFQDIKLQMAILGLIKSSGTECDWLTRCEI